MSADSFFAEANFSRISKLSLNFMTAEVITYLIISDFISLSLFQQNNAS